jgi:hypothetical protein
MRRMAPVEPLDLVSLEPYEFWSNHNWALIEHDLFRKPYLLFGIMR